MAIGNEIVSVVGAAGTGFIVGLLEIWSISRIGRAYIRDVGAGSERKSGGILLLFRLAIVFATIGGLLFLMRDHSLPLICGLFGGFLSGLVFFVLAPNNKSIF